MEVKFLFSTSIVSILVVVSTIYANTTTQLPESKSESTSTFSGDLQESPDDPEEDPDSVKPSINPEESNQTNIIPYGKPCDKNNPEACQNFPTVQCVTDSLRISTCRCSFFRTWEPAKNNCILNVFSPCSKGVPGQSDLECGQNADCINDTIKMNNHKFCRCRRGFKPILNKDKIPSKCVAAPPSEFDEFDFPDDYETGMASPKAMSWPLLLLSTVVLAYYHN